MTHGFPIIDAHVHFYDGSRPEGVSWPPAGSRFPPTAFSYDLIRFAHPLKIDGVILVETGSRNVDDEWLLNLAQEDPRILGVVAHLQPGETGFESRLKTRSACSWLKGIRLRPIKHYDLKCSGLRKDLTLLSNYGLTLELGATTHKKMVDFINLAGELSDISCGLTHLGHPIIDGEKPDQEWADSVLQLSALPNTFCKLTSLTEFTRSVPPPDHPDLYRPVVEFLLEAFGEDRLIYGSNWPNSAQLGSYETNVRLYEQMFNGDPCLMEKLMSRNARRIYRL